MCQIFFQEKKPYRHLCLKFLYIFGIPSGKAGLHTQTIAWHWHRRRGIHLYANWIGLIASTLLAFIWMEICGPPASSVSAVLAGLMTVVQGYIGYRLGRYYDRLREMAYLDSLTGVLVNRRFTERLYQEVERARRHQYPVTLLFIDLDNFKQYNDMHGHAAGDKILSRFADLLKGSVREQDTVGRWGGEEFVVLMPHTDTEQGIVVGERIRRNIRQGLTGITASIGLATFPSHASTAGSLQTRRIP
jgi:diguanylate cyclase (GGDEF)-like protein